MVAEIRLTQVAILASSANTKSFKRLKKNPNVVIIFVQVLGLPSKEMPSYACIKAPMVMNVGYRESQSCHHVHPAFMFSFYY